jgi:hypothetical protein
MSKRWIPLEEYEASITFTKDVMVVLTFLNATGQSAPRTMLQTARWVRQASAVPDESIASGGK